MKFWICSSLLLAACSGLQAAEPAGGNADIAQFVKEGGRFVSRLNEDVTGDGVADVVIVMANDKRFEATVTVLMRLHGKPVVGTRPMEGLQGVDSLTLDLSPFGPPTLRVVKGVLIIDHLTGGNTVRTVATYRYRFDADEGRMRLIGLDAERTSTTFGAKVSWNAVTGARIFTSGMREGQTIRYGPPARTTYKLGTVYMSLEPTPDELIDRALDEKKKQGK